MIPTSAIAITALAATSVFLHAQEVKPAPEGEASPANLDPASYRQVEVLLRAIETIRENYVDADQVGYEQLVEGAVEGMFARLDKHSQYMSPRLFKELRAANSNPKNSSGIGLVGGDAGLTISMVPDGSPAARAGLKVGDQLLSVGGRDLSKATPMEALAALDGVPGTLITIEVEREGGGKKTIGFARSAPLLKSVKGATLLPSKVTGGTKIGYARIDEFQDPTARALADALDSLEKKGMRAFILDLRDNPGGLLETAVEVCGEFVPPETLIAKTIGRPGTENSELYKTPPSQRRQRDYPLAVLINKNSASSSEVVAGALQERGRAIVVGEKSFGKGSVQTVLTMGLDTGAAMRLTTARFYTAKGKPIDDRGITPDISIPGEELPINAAAEALAKKIKG